MYTGVTNDLKRRLERHKSGKGAKFTRSFKVSRLVYLEKRPARGDALKREARIKTLTRKEKLALISGAALSDLPH